MTVGIMMDRGLGLRKAPPQGASMPYLGLRSVMVDSAYPPSMESCIRPV
ncbi:MAG: hypothetical protein JRN50_02665 [Nitrososphaerota archaeon]|nr:hypothetical protein [Nitrososphaerota archaeon]